MKRHKNLNKEEKIFQFIDNAILEVCLTTPQDRICELVPINDEFVDKIQVNSPSDCFHTRFSFMNDLTASVSHKTVS